MVPQDGPVVELPGQPNRPPVTPMPQVYNQPVPAPLPVLDTRVVKHSPLAFIMLGVSLIYLLAAVIPTYKIDTSTSSAARYVRSIFGYGSTGKAMYERGISILDSFKLFNQSTIRMIQGFCLLFFIAGVVLTIISLICACRRKNRTSWLLMALTAILSFVGILLWMLEWRIILRVLNSNFLTKSTLGSAIHPNIYLYIAMATAVFMIIFSFINMARSRNR